MENLRNSKNWSEYKKRLEDIDSKCYARVNDQKPPSGVYGLTSPISLDYPQPVDIERSSALLNILKSYDQFESEEQAFRRMKVIKQLNMLLRQWTQHIAVKKNLSSSVTEKPGGKLYVFGSYRLGVHSQDTDIDALCVVPRYVDRTDFFSTFANLLRKQPEVSCLRCIEAAFVPVIKLNFDGIEVDLLFARLALTEIPEDLKLDDVSLLKNLDIECVRSLNGPRITDAIAHLVPNLESFQLAVRCIKIWAKRRGIYSNILGFFGGVSWTILVARTCQLYPNAAPATLVEKFFFIFSQWHWPQPVMLKKPDPNTMGMPVWDPRINVSDRAHLMPVITPCYPQQNSTFNVSFSTKTIIQRELLHGQNVMKEIIAGSSDWRKLFEGPNFFRKYKHYILIAASAKTKEHHVEWIGSVQRKLRTLVADIEKYQCVNLAHVNLEAFPPLEVEANKYQSQFFIGLEFVKMQKVNINLEQEVFKFTGAVSSNAISSNLFKEGMTIDAKYVRRNDLNKYLSSSKLQKNQIKAEKHI